jgi:hypothetical protein
MKRNQVEIHKHEPHGPKSSRQIKLHKNTSIGQIINWKNPPSYELAKCLTKILRNYLHLPHAYNFRNSIHLITDLIIHGN